MYSEILSNELIRARNSDLSFITKGMKVETWVGLAGPPGHLEDGGEGEAGDGRGHGALGGDHHHPGEGDGDQTQGVHVPHEPSLGQPE